MNVKSNKGVTITVLTVTIIVLVIITSITIYTSQAQLGIKYLNYLDADIDLIDTKISEYYLKNGDIPVLEPPYAESPEEL